LQNPEILLGWFVVFIFSVTVHEAAHAWIALRGGDKTAYATGQVSLNPMPHIRREPFGMVVLPIISVIFIGWPIGYASAPFDPVWAERHHKRAAIMALAGPVSNLIIALICILIMYIGLNTEVLRPGTDIYLQVVSAEKGSMLSSLTWLLSMLMLMNLLLFIINILPIPPLDGSAVVPLFLNEKLARRYQAFIYNPMFSIIGMLFIFFIIRYIFPPIHSLALSLVYA